MPFLSASTKIRQTDDLDILKLNSTSILIRLALFEVSVAAISLFLLPLREIGLGIWIFAAISGAIVALGLFIFVGQKTSRFSTHSDFFTISMFHFILIYVIAPIMGIMVIISNSYLNLQIPEEMYNFFMNLTSFFVSFFSFYLLLSATTKTDYFIDLKSREFVIGYRIFIFKYLQERRLKKGNLKTILVTHGGKGWAKLFIENLSKEKIKIASRGSNDLFLLALHLMEHLKIPVVVEERKFLKDKMSKQFDPEIFEQKEEFPDPYLTVWNSDVRALEKDLLKIGWEKVKDSPFVLQYQKLRRSMLLLTLITSIMMAPCFFFFSLVLSTFVVDFLMAQNLLHYLPITIYVSPDIFFLFAALLISFLLEIIFISWMIFFVLRSKKLVKIEERGIRLEVGNQGISGNLMSNIVTKIMKLRLCDNIWPYNFIKSLRIEKKATAFRRCIFQVSIDFFLGTEDLAYFKFKADAEKFRDYLSYVCRTYQEKLSGNFLARG